MARTSSAEAAAVARTADGLRDTAALDLHLARYGRCGSRPDSGSARLRRLARSAPDRPPRSRHFVPHRALRVPHIARDLRRENLAFHRLGRVDRLLRTHRDLRADRPGSGFRPKNFHGRFPKNAHSGVYHYAITVQRGSDPPVTKDPTIVNSN